MFIFFAGRAVLNLLLFFTRNSTDYYSLDNSPKEILSEAANVPRLNNASLKKGTCQVHCYGLESLSFLTQTPLQLFGCCLVSCTAW